MGRKKAGAPGCIILGQCYNDTEWHTCRPWVLPGAGSISAERYENERVTGRKKTRTRLRKEDRKEEGRKREQGGRPSHIAAAAAPGIGTIKTTIVRQRLQCKESRERGSSLRKGKG